MMQWWAKLATVCDGSDASALSIQNVVDCVTKFEPRPSRVINWNKFFGCLLYLWDSTLQLVNDFWSTRCGVWVSGLFDLIRLYVSRTSIGSSHNIYFPPWNWTPCGRLWLCGVCWQLWQLPPRLWRGIYSPSLGSQQVSWIRLGTPKPQTLLMLGLVSSSRGHLLENQT